MLEIIEAVLAVPLGEHARKGIHPDMTFRDSILAHLSMHPCLLIFNGFDMMPDDKDVVNFLDRIPSFSKVPNPSKVLITSRRRVGLLGQELVLQLGPLTEEEAIQLLALATHRYGVEIAPDEVKEIERIVDGLPLAIALVAAQAAVIPLDELKARLEQKGLEEVTNLETTLRAIYDRLPYAARSLFQCLAAFEGDTCEETIGQVCAA